ncbi:SHOCT domain-containing protein [Gracilimonas tropica]|uniref:SHOCT domain-containing protein n=1 Tax=Gracilimonas tropica TaxID=454600 RepID=UPI0003A7E4CA|nr:SHOCT domain-containing protein [Gracilimonas tropica]
MWFDTIWNTPLIWWLLLTVFGTGLIILVFLLWRHRKPEPVKENLDYFCRCYARGEISQEDFEELKNDLQEFEKQYYTPKKRKLTPQT